MTEQSGVQSPLSSSEESGTPPSNTAAPEPQKIFMLTGDDLAPRITHCHIVTKDGMDITIPMKTLSWFDWDRIGNSVPMLKKEELPQKRVEGPAGVKLETDWVLVRQRMNELDQERNYRRLAFALTQAGHWPDLKEKTLPEQSEFLRSRDISIVGALIGHLEAVITGTQSEVVSLSENFQRVRTEHDVNLPSLEDASGRVVESVAV